MKLVSVNCGLPREVLWRGQKVTTSIYKEPIHGRIALLTLNLDSDEQSDLTVHGGNLMLCDDFSAQMGGKSETPEALGGSPVTFHIHVDNADEAWDKAVKAGAEITMPLADQFWGDRYGQLRDPFGHKWSIGHTKATPTQAELEKGAKEALVG